MIQQKILSQLIHNKKLRFSDLWDKNVESNKFSYHLKKLEENGLIAKTEEHYSLTSKGKSFAVYLEGETGQQKKQPLNVTVIVPIKNDELLMHQRLKEPFHGYWGFVAGKQKFEVPLSKTAEEELEEEAGLIGNVEYKGLLSTRTFNNDELSYHHNLHVFKCENPIGELKNECREGKNEWMKLGEIGELKVFPDIQNIIKIALNKKQTYLEQDRYQKNDEFLN